MSTKDQPSTQLEKVLSENSHNSVHKEDVEQLEQDVVANDWSEEEERALV